MAAVDPLAEFADRDRATRDQIATVGHRGYTLPSFYPTHGDYLRAELAAHQARYRLMVDMALAVPTDSVLYRLLADACVDAMAPVVEVRKWLADWDKQQAVIAQRDAYTTYAPNLRAVA